MVKATVICDSINENGNRLTTFELEYPRIIHSEMLTHRQLSRNAASSRAIPFDKMLQQLEGVPSRFGAAQKGMQDNGEEYVTYIDPRAIWNHAKHSAIEYSCSLKEAGYHKQVYNRLTEPYQMIKVVATATEWSNFFWLRNDVMADPTIAELARKMKEVYDNSTPQLLKAGEYHLPYVQVDYFNTGEGVEQHFYESTDGNYSLGDYLTTDQAIKVSAARCAAVSYRNEDYTLEKCLQLYDRLVGDERKHSSALEHQATPMNTQHFYNGINLSRLPDTWEEGISHADRDGNLWSGNFKGFIQHRKTVKGECYDNI